MKIPCFYLMLYVAEITTGNNCLHFFCFHLLQISWEGSLLLIKCTFVLTNDKSPFKYHLPIMLLRFVSANFFTKLETKKKHRKKMIFLRLEYIDKIYSATTIYQIYFFEKTSPMQYANAFSVNWFTWRTSNRPKSSEM